MAPSRILIVKLSSLGDVVHTYPAVTDAARALPGVEIDWVVDEAFAPLARLHPAVANVIALPIRRWKKAPAALWTQMRDAVRALRARPYDVIIDAQGLMKSALVARLAKGPRHGFGRGSARETIATFAYRHGHDIPETEHMATRIRRLFAMALGYAMPQTPADPGLRRETPVRATGERGDVLLLHGTSWPTKTWTVDGWRELASRAGEAGFGVRLFAHGTIESERAAAIASGHDHVRLIPPGGLETIIPQVASASAAVTVDTGLGHLAAAFGIPTIGLYGPTNPGLTGLVGLAATEFVATIDCAPCEKAACRIRPNFGEGPPCLAQHSADRVWRGLAARLGN